MKSKYLTQDDLQPIYERLNELENIVMKPVPNEEVVNAAMVFVSGSVEFDEQNDATPAKLELKKKQACAQLMRELREHGLVDFSVENGKLSAGLKIAQLK